jgi:hypothetical protein
MIMNGMLPSRRYRSGLGEDGDSCAELRLPSHPEGRGTAQQAARRLSNIQNIEAENIKKWNEQIISVILPL